MLALAEKLTRAINDHPFPVMFESANGELRLAHRDSAAAFHRINMQSSDMEFALGHGEFDRCDADDFRHECPPLRREETKQPRWINRLMQRARRGVTLLVLNSK